MKAKYIVWILIIVFLSYGIYFYTKPYHPLDSRFIIDKILVLKHKRELSLLSNDSIIKTYKISLGKQPKGEKEYEGDKKTPEGKYIINDKNPNSKYHKNLGISYPNSKDKKHAQKMRKSPGGQIKIHGIKNGMGWVGRFHLLFDWTLGCIAVTDQEIDEIYENVKIGTPIEIRQ